MEGGGEEIVSKFKQNERENVITESVFVNFKHTGAITFEITNKRTNKNLQIKG
jgi:hypothetical protein